jgi:hypothetical protein
MRNIVIAATVFVFAGIAGGVLLLSGLLTSQAVQDPTISIDMIPAGTTYDDTTNTMSVGSIDNCLTTAAPGNNVLHLHVAHVVIQNVEDLVGWQVRLNYLGDRFRPNTVSFIPFADTTTGQNISFNNLPIDAGGVHRDLSTASVIPPGAPGPQTAAFGATIIGAPDFPTSPDTPAKAVPDDSSYSAPTGGVLASFTAQVPAGNAGQASLFLDMDDSNPNDPGSGFAFFDGTGTQDVLLPPEKLGDGTHGEGASCGTPSPCPTPGPTSPPIFINDETFTNQLGQSASDLHSRYDGPVGACLLQNAPGCPSPVVSHLGTQFNYDWGTACVDNGESVTVRVSSEPPAIRICSDWTLFGQVIGPANPPSCVTPTPPPPTPTPFPVAGHDARLTRISGVPKNVRLSPGEVIADSASIVVANQGDHAETIGVYVDVSAPAAGGCLPNGRVLQTTVTLGAGNMTTIPVSVSYSCTDPSAAEGQSYTWTAVADHGADDLASCVAGSLAGLTCFNALADDDEDPADNRKSLTGPKVIAQ